MKAPQLIVAVIGLCCSLVSASVVVASTAEDSTTVQRRRLFDVANTQPEPAAAAAATSTHIRGASVDTNLFLAEESDEELVRALGYYGSLVRSRTISGLDTPPVRYPQCNRSYEPFSF
jgi:hypothetical protein